MSCIAIGIVRLSPTTKYSSGPSVTSPSCQSSRLSRIRLVDRLAVDRDHARLDRQPFTRQRDQALDVHDRSAGHAHGDDIAAPRLAKSVRQRVDEDQLAGLDRRRPCSGRRRAPAAAHEPKVTYATAMSMAARIAVRRGLAPASQRRARASLVVTERADAFLVASVLARHEDAAAIEIAAVHVQRHRRGVRLRVGQHVIVGRRNQPSGGADAGASAAARSP